MAMTLNHFSIRTLDLAATDRFWCEVLGFVAGPRPPFPFPGTWLYAEPSEDYAKAVVHVIGIDRHDPEGLKQYLGDRDASSLQGTGAVDHVAFFVTGLAGMLAKLRSHGIDPRQRTVPSLGLHQLFVEDPNGVVVELNFPAHESGA